MAKVVELGGGWMYEGEVNPAGQPHGRGVSRYTGGGPDDRDYYEGDRYEGEWFEGQRHGQGVETGELSGIPYRYEGEWHRGLEHGHGVTTMNPIVRREGGHRNGEEHGQTTLTRADGQCFKCVFRGALPHGHGVTTYPDGRRIEGSYRDGKKEGTFTVTSPDGTTRTVEYRDGEPVDAGDSAPSE